MTNGKSIWFGQFSIFSSVQFSSVAQSCPTLCHPKNHSTPGLLDHHQLPEFNQTHARWVGDAIQPSHPLSSPSPPTLNLPPHPASGSFPMSQLFSWGGQSTGVSASASVLPMNTQDWSLGRTGYIWLKNLNYTKYTLSQNIRPNAFYKWAPPDFSIIGKDRDAGKDWGQEKKGAVEDEMGVWHY